jgi:hypothetical protein
MHLERGHVDATATAAAAAADDEGLGELSNFDDDTMIVANNEFKLKVWSCAEDGDVDSNAKAAKGASSSTSSSSSTSKACRQTLLGPTYGGPIDWLFPLPQRAANGMDIVLSQYMVYGASERVIGLVGVATALLKFICVLFCVAPWVVRLLF